MVRMCGYYWGRNNNNEMRDKYLYPDQGGKEVKSWSESKQGSLEECCHLQINECLFKAFYTFFLSICFPGQANSLLFSFLPSILAEFSVDIHVTMSEKHIT